MPRAEGSPYARHIPSLDGLRAFAVVGVMASHLFPGTPSGPLTRFLGGAFAAGATGVDLFFVLSGFLITGILFDSLSDPRFFRKFYARRVLRIFPLYYAVLLVFFALSLVEHIPDRRELLSLALYLQNTSWIASPSWAFLPPGALPLDHFWSLAVEEQFYLVWPLLVWAIKSRRPLLWLCLAAFVLCPALRMVRDLGGAGYMPIHTSTLCRADTLLAGGALALALRSRFHDRVLRATRWLWLALLPAAFIWANILPPLSVSARALVYALWPTLLTAVYTALLALALVPGTVAKVCSLAPLRWIGKYSYGLYIYHVILAHWIGGPLKALLASHLHSRVLMIAATGTVIALISAAVAYASFQLMERHFLRLKRFFDYRPHPDTAAA